MDIAWITDPHLNCLRAHGAQTAFGRYIAEDLKDFEKPIVVISGDISECMPLTNHLVGFIEGLNEVRKIPTYFVLGNHDFYGGTIEATRYVAKAVENIAKGIGSEARWLTQAGVIELTPELALVGHDGWYDGRYGNPEGSQILLNDFYLIGDLAGKDLEGEPKPLPRMALLLKIRQIADRFAEEAKPVLIEAMKKYKKVVFVTHVPPFKVTAWHMGSTSDNHWLPWMTSKAMGDMLLDVAYQFPEGEIQVLCGHTHSEGEVQILPNLNVMTGKATCGVPDIHKVLQMGD